MHTIIGIYAVFISQFMLDARTSCCGFVWTSTDTRFKVEEIKQNAADSDTINMLVKELPLFGLNLSLVDQAMFVDVTARSFNSVICSSIYQPFAPSADKHNSSYRTL